MVSTKLAAMVDIRANAGRDIGTMDEWAAACGVQRAEGVQLTSEDGEDFSVMTTEDIPANNPLLFVPGNMIWTSSQVRQELDGPGIESAEALLVTLGIENEMEQFALFLKVLVEYEKGDQSPWYPWLNAMPRVYYNGASMTRKFWNLLLDAGAKIECYFLTHPNVVNFIFAPSLLLRMPSTVGGVVGHE